MLAHVNTTGQHIALWLDGDSPAMGWGQSPSFPYQEGSFYGNIFISPPKAYYCNGKDFDQGMVPGRLGTGQNDAPYVNPLGYSGAQCRNYCTPVNYAGDGWSRCPGYNGEQFKHVVTVWRNFDASTPYKICNRMSGKCLDVAGGSAAAGAMIVQRSYAGAASQKWSVAQVAPGKYKIININSGLALDVNGAYKYNGTTLIQSAYSGDADQLWSIGSMADGTGYNKLAPSSSGGTVITLPSNGYYTDGSWMDLWQYLYADFQKWTISVAT
jgi:hypothetical protein